MTVASAAGRNGSQVKSKSKSGAKGKVATRASQKSSGGEAALLV
jgi:hypothetical protein